MQLEEFGLLAFDSSDWKQMGSVFLGIGYNRTAVVLGDAGYQAFRATHGQHSVDDFQDGRYIAVIEEEDRFRVLTDPMGQDVLYYYSPDELVEGGPPVARWAVSNSLLALAGRARRFGPVELYRPSVLGFQVSGGKAIGAQLFSNNTPVAGARVLPLGCELHVSKADGSATLRRIRPGDWLIRDDGRSYEELIATYVHDTLAVCAALQGAGELDLLCDISGGHDSRAVMAMLQKSGGSSRISYTSDATKPDDYRIARLLARHYGRRLHSRAQVPVQLDGRAAFEVWAHGSAGVYLPIVTPRAAQEASRLRFHGGNFLSKEFAELTPSDKAATFSKWIKTGNTDKRSVADEFLASFGHIDMDIDAPFAMQMHYINFRGRFHYGRNWYSHTRAPMITPLISQTLARAAFRLTPEEYNHSRVSLDLLLALDNALGTIPFDAPEKDFTMEEVEASPFWKRPLAFEPGTLPKVFGPDVTAAPAGGEESPGGPGFMDVFRSRFPDMLESVRGAALFGESYLERAAKEAGAPKAPAHQMRAAAHVVHAGLLLSELS